MSEEAEKAYYWLFLHKHQSIINLRVRKMKILISTIMPKLLGNLLFSIQLPWNLDVWARQLHFRLALFINERLKINLKNLSQLHGLKIILDILKTRTVANLNFNLKHWYTLHCIIFLIIIDILIYYICTKLIGFSKMHFFKLEIFTILMQMMIGGLTSVKWTIGTLGFGLF